MATGFTEPLVHSPIASQKDYWYRSGMGMVNSAEWVVFFDDFSQAEEATEDQVGWTSLIDTGATIVDGDEHGGVIDISSDAADEGVALYHNKCVKLAGKKFFMEARVKVEDADDGQIVIGLSDLSTTTNPEDLYTTQSDFLAFGTHVDADATPALIYDKNNGGPVTDTPTGATFDLSDGTWHTIAIWYNGAATADTSGALVAFVDGVEATRASTDAQIPDDLPLAPFIAAVLEDDATDIISIDYVRYAFER
jgi:hypothetical protein